MYIQSDSICYSGRNKHADKGSPIDLYSEKQDSNISEEPIYPEYYQQLAIIQVCPCIFNFFLAKLPLAL